MFSSNDSNVRKFNTINRRVFILSIAKGVVFTGILADFLHFKLAIIKNISLYLIKIDLESGDCLQ